FCVGFVIRRCNKCGKVRVRYRHRIHQELADENLLNWTLVRIAIRTSHHETARRNHNHSFVVIAVALELWLGDYLADRVFLNLVAVTVSVSVTITVAGNYPCFHFRYHAGDSSVRYEVAICVWNQRKGSYCGRLSQWRRSAFESGSNLYIFARCHERVFPVGQTL